MTAPQLVFASPRKLPKADTLAGRVVVLDIAFAADGVGPGFAKITGKFLHELGPRLARWVDHHDHDKHAEYRHDQRFVLHSKAEHGACPEIITPQMVHETGPIDTIVSHFDLDGLYSAAKWILGGKEPYPGADDDARVIDTRIGVASPVANMIDQALRAHFADDVLKRRIVHYLVNGLQPGMEYESIMAAVQDFASSAQQAKILAQEYQINGDVAVIAPPRNTPEYDKTELLLLGQKLAKVAVVVDGNNATIAADFNSGINFVELLHLGGGMPTRVSIPVKRLDRALAKIRKLLCEQTSSSGS